MAAKEKKSFFYSAVVIRRRSKLIFSWLKNTGENTVNKAVKYNTGDYLNSPEKVAVYIESVLEEDDPALLLVALRNVADSQGGMAMMAEHSGLSRESLYRTLSKNGIPKISTLMLIMKALGLHLSVKVA